MSQKIDRRYFSDGSFLEGVIEEVEVDKWRPHGIRYRLAWIQNGVCRVLFDNHHGKTDHCHIEGIERRYTFSTVEQLKSDFFDEIQKLGGPI